MATHQHTLNVPPELLDEIFEHLMDPYNPLEDDIPPGFGDEGKGMVALANCAQACRAFLNPALKVLWKEQSVTRAWSTVLRDAAFKGDDDESEDDDEGNEDDDEGNEDWPKGDPEESACYYVRVHHLTRYSALSDTSKQSYIDRSLEPEQWLRLKFYAQFVRVLYYTIDERINPTVFFFLQEHSHGEPLFPNLRTIVWAHAIPEILSVLSPTVEHIRFLFSEEEEENIGRPQEIAYRVRRHTFKTLLPRMLTVLPRLRELELRPLRHEGFWQGFGKVPNLSLVTPNLRNLHITEPMPVLLRGALPIISAMKSLEELTISAHLPEDVLVPSQFEIAHINWPKESLRPFENLRTLHISSGVAAMAYLVDIIKTPCLENVTMRCEGEWKYDQEFISKQTLDLLRGALQILCTRHAYTMQVVVLDFGQLRLPKGADPSDEDSEAASHSPFWTLIKPLLELHRLREFVVDIKPAGTPMDVPLPTMLAAWPMLERLDVAVLGLSPDSLHTAARICPRLQRLRAMRLSEGFLKAIGIPVQSGLQAAEGEHPLRELRFYAPSKQVDVVKIAGFVHALFPRLRVQECMGAKYFRCKHEENWLDVLEEITKLQAPGGRLDRAC